MRKITVALLCALLGIPAFSQPTFIPPLHPDLVLPASTTNHVYLPIKTSAYSYERVRFDTVAGTGVGYRPQNLYIYSWNGANFVNSGIAWCRRDTLGNLRDTGYITVPTWKTYMSVGILQNNDSSKTYAIVSYYGGTTGVPGGFYFDIYEWTPTGFSSIPSYGTVAISPIDTGKKLRWGFNRIKMDTWNLKRAAFVWDEAQSLHWDSSAYNPGGIYVKVLNNSTAPPFYGSTSDSLRVIGSDAWGVKPDVAFGDSGNVVRIAYYNSDTSYTSGKPLYVRNRLFSAIMGTPWPTINFNWDDSVSNAIFLTDLSANDHINIDCPDNYPYDIWSVVYNYDPVTMFARTKPISGPNISQMLNLYLTQPNRYPTIAYSRDGNQINYGWFAGWNSNYVATRLYNSGSAFVPPSIAGTYFNIAFYPSVTPGAPGTRLSFSRQNDRNASLFMAYPLPGVLGPGPYLDMRSKLVPWTATAFRPGGTGLEEVGSNSGISVYPNPFTKQLTIRITDYNNESLHMVMTDIEGKVSGTASGNLDKVNSALQQLSSEVAAGVYLINLNSPSGSYHKMFKVVKQ